MEKDLRIVFGDRKDGMGLMDTVIDVNTLELGSGNVEMINDHIMLYNDWQNNIDYFIGYESDKDMFIDLSDEDINYIKNLRKGE